MAITVTATQSGAGANNGTTLTVKVVTGQATNPIGASAGSITVTTPRLAVTPNGTGSWVYGAVVNGNAATAFTPAANTTFSQNVTIGSITEGTFRTTGTTTSGVGVTVGATAPTGIPSGACDIALLEVTTAGTLVEDASSPAGVNANATTVSTAAFTPATGSLLVATTTCNATGSGPVNITVSGGTLTWTQQVVAGNVTGTACATVWTADIAGVGLSLVGGSYQTFIG